MGESFCKNDCCCCDNDSIRKTLIENIGRVVIVFTTTGGCAGEGFTGLVTTVCDGTVKLVTTLPSAPISPFAGHSKCCCGSTKEFNLCRKCPCSHFGSALIIPLCHITSVVVAEV